MTVKTLFLADEAAQESLAGQVAQYCLPGTVIFLQGDLGTGKTTFVRGFLHALGHIGVVKSPTYTLVEPYSIGNKHIYHFDLYRLADPDELEYAGGRDYFDNESICLVEWPEKAEAYLPKADLLCRIRYENAGRVIEITPGSPEGRAIIKQLS